MAPPAGFGPPAAWVRKYWSRTEADAENEFRGPEGKRNGVIATMGMDSFVRADLEFEANRSITCQCDTRGTARFCNRARSLKRSLKVDLNKGFSWPKTPRRGQAQLPQQCYRRQLDERGLSYRLFLMRSACSAHGLRARVRNVPGSTSASTWDSIRWWRYRQQLREGPFRLEEGRSFKPVGHEMFEDMGTIGATISRPMIPRQLFPTKNRTRDRFLQAGVPMRMMRSSSRSWMNSWILTSSARFMP